MPVSGAAEVPHDFLAQPGNEQLRIDYQLAEAMVTGFDPLHLAEVFGISEHTAISYAVNARQLTGWAHQQAPRIP